MLTETSQLKPDLSIKETTPFSLQNSRGRISFLPLSTRVQRGIRINYLTTMIHQNPNFHNYFLQDPSSTLSTYVCYPETKRLIYDLSDAMTIQEAISDLGRIMLPLNVDTEYNMNQLNRKVIMNQIRPLNSPTLIYNDRPNKEYGFVIDHNHPHRVLQYLTQQGFTYNEVRHGYKDLFNEEMKELIVDLYGFFLTADYYKMMDTDSWLCKEYMVKELTLNLNETNRYKRATGKRINDRGGLDYSNEDRHKDLIRMPYELNYQGENLKLSFRLVDIGKMHGVETYANTASNVDYELPFKALLNGKEKGRIHELFDSSDSILQTESEFNCVETMVLASRIYNKEEDRISFLKEHLTDYGRTALYAGIDCHSHEILSKYHDMMRIVYKDLGLEKHYNDPKLTLGRTIIDMFEASINANLEVDNNPTNKYLNRRELLLPNSAKGMVTTTIVNEYGLNVPLEDNKFTDGDSCLLTRKMQGGLMANNQPTHILSKGVFVDMDEETAYATSMEPQPFPMGKVEHINHIVSEGKDGKIIFLNGKKPKTLRYYVNNIRPGVFKNLELLFIRNKKPFSKDQNIVQSYTPPKGWTKTRTDLSSIYSEYANSDEYMENDFLEGEQDVKLYTREVNLGVVVSANLDAILYDCDPVLRNEFLDCEVIAATYHLKKDYIPFEKFKRKIADFRPYQEMISKVKKENRTPEFWAEMKMLCNDAGVDWYPTQKYWSYKTLGDLLVTKLKNKRGEYKKLKSKATNSEEKRKYDALQKLYKIFNNALYGSLGSRFFTIGNILAMNNVTAKVRVGLAGLVVSLNGFQPITDGVCFNINKVLRGRNSDGSCRSLTPSDCILDKYGELKNQKERWKHGFEYVTLGFQLGWLNWEFGENGIVIGEKQTNKGIIKVKFHPTKPDDEGYVDTEKHDLVKYLNKTLIPQHIRLVYPKLANRLFNDGKSENRMKTCAIPYLIDTGLHKLAQSIMYENRENKLNFKISCKGVYSKWATQGAGDYASYDPSQIHDKYKISVKKRSHDAKIEGKEVIINYFFNDLEKPKEVPIPPHYTTEKILKVGEFYERWNYYKDTWLLPGDTKTVVKSFGLHNPSQYVYQTREQRISLLKEREKSIEKFGISVERYFINGYDDNGNPLIDVESMYKHYLKTVQMGFKKFSEYAKNQKLKASHTLKEDLPVLQCKEMKKCEVDDVYKISGCYRNQRRWGGVHNPKEEEERETPVG